MGYFIDNRKVKFSDLETSGIYSDILMDEVKKGNYDELKKILHIDTRKNKDFMEPLMYAVKNEKGTYAIYRYYHEMLQNDTVLGTEIIIKEPELIENTPLSRKEEFILKAAEINPEVIAHMSDDLKKDGRFIGKLCELQNKEVTQRTIRECDMSEVLKQNHELKKNETFMMQAILQSPNLLEDVSEELKNDYKFMKEVSKNTEVIDYVVEHIEQFGQEGLNATKDALVEIFIAEAISGFEEESKKVTEQITQIQNKEENEGLDELIKRNKQLQRHIKFFERIQKGEIDPIRAAKLIDRCQNIEPEFKQKIDQLKKLYEAIIESDKRDINSQSLNTGVVVKEIMESDEFRKMFFVNKQATRENHTQKNNAIYLEINGVSPLDSVVHIIMELHRAGQPVVTAFNSFKIDTRQYGSEQDIIEAYDRAREEYQKSKKMLASAIQATEGEYTGIGQINEAVIKIREIKENENENVREEIEEVH